MEGVIPATGFARSERVEMRSEVNESVVRAYREHYVDVARLALLLVHDADCAEDLTHQAFARLHVRWDRIKDADRTLAFLQTTLVKLARSKRARRAAPPRRRRRHRRTEVGAAEISQVSPHHEQVVEALARLPERQRVAIVLHDYVHLTDDEIASTMGCRVRAARAHLRRANAAMSTSLGADR